MDALKNLPMDFSIDFFDFSNETTRGRKLKNMSCSIWYNKSKNKTYAVTFSNDILTEKEYVKIGRIGNRICFVFTDEKAIRLSKNRNILFRSKQFISMIYGKVDELTELRQRTIYGLEKLGQDVYLLNEHKS
tara:strand:+ start:10973 stop:11368 length:396 start_codon:yes stop_codon:yes gene_type:complete